VTEYADHPFASIFPMMAPDEYGALREDIRAHGLREPIWLFEGQILDGRNRYRACQDVGVTPRADTYIGDDPIAFVISLNLQRRHLTPGQKADVALRAEDVIAAEARQRQRTGKGADGSGGRGKKRNLVEKIPQGFSAPKTRDLTAKALGVNPHYVQDQKKLRAQAPALAERVAAGSLSVPAAMRQYREEQQKAELTAAPPTTLPAGLAVGDFRALAADLADNSVALIFTDPPYDRKTIPLFDDLGRVAARVLKPGGSLITYCGQVQLPEALSLLSGHLRYWWLNACVQRDGHNEMRRYGIKSQWKPMLWFVKDTRGDVQTFVADMVSGGREKGVHAWQQAEAEAAYYVERLCPVGGIVYDPFAGGGTTPAVCQRLGRHWIAHEQNPTTAARLIERLETAS